MPTPLRTLFEKPIDRHIEGVIKADDESDLLTEVSEYVVTREVAKRLDELLGAYLAGGVANGVWIAGFFGSGKSHLLKLLSLLLENRLLGTTRVADLFLPKLDTEDTLLKADLEKAIKIPSRSVRFNIDQKADLIAKDQMDALLAVFVKVFNELRGFYPKQGYIAELEAELEARALLTPFKDAYRAEAKGRPWEEDRDVVHTLENETFARAYAKVTGMAYAEALQALDRKQSSYKVSIESFADSVRAWLDRQPPNFRLNFFVDEVGQFIGTNSKLMLNLQTLAETLATKCQGRAWLFVTSQGDLATVLGEMGTNQGNDFTKIQGRFKTLLNLTSQDVAEVICRRLLAKNPARPEPLTTLYATEKNNLKTLFQFGDGSRTYRGFKDDADFCNFYPFHPYQFELLQAALIALSKHNFFTGRQRSIGERSMLGILQDVVKTIANDPVGRFATFERMFEGIRNALRADLQNAIQTAERNLGGSASLSVRLLKALFLLKFVKEFKSTPRNLAVLLIDRCDLDIAKHEADVRTALNQLENDTYIQRNGDIYEFLTDDEKDVETEIKDMAVDDTDIAELLGQIVFDDIIQDTKLRFEDNKQDYPFTRRLDGQVFRKREYDLSIHVASPLHENYDKPTDLVAQSMGKAELLFILPADKLLFDDLKLHRQTEKYVQQNLSPTLPETRRAILTTKAQKNVDRRASLHDRLKDALCKARLVLNGNDLAHASTDARTRVAKAFQDLVRYAFPSLRMVRKNFAEADLVQILSTPADDFFKNDDGTLGEAEQEILLKLQLARAQGQRVAASDSLATFEKKPYGWPQTSTLCLLARLFMRGKVELRNGGNLLTADEAMDALSNNRSFANTVVTLQEQFDAAAVTKLKKFHQDFFHAPSPAADAKDAALEFQRCVRAEAAELEKLASHAGTYPFMAALAPIAAQLKALADREWSHCLRNLAEFQDTLLDAKEKTIDPLKSFYNGPKRGIYDDVMAFLHDEEANFADVTGSEAAELRETLASPAPHKSNTLQLVKAKLDSLRTKVSQVVTIARADASSRVEQARASVQAAPDFGSLTPEEQAEVQQPFTDATTKIQKERLAPVIRQIADRAANEALPRQLQRIAELANARKPAEMKDASPVQYVSARLIPIVYNKAILETEADLEAYLAALRKAFAAELRNKKRITL
jgi:Family of unknown function (DUF6079)